MPTNSNVNNLLFEELDILEYQRVGECVLDNWKIDAIVYDANQNGKPRLKREVKRIAKETGIPLITVGQLGALK